MNATRCPICKSLHPFGQRTCWKCIEQVRQVQYWSPLQ